VHPLVAEVESGGEFAERRAAEVEPAHGPMELRLGDLGGVIGLDHPLLRLPGGGQQPLVHPSSVPRR